MFYQGYWIPDDMAMNAGGGNPYAYDLSQSTGGGGDPGFYDPYGGYVENPGSIYNLPTGTPGSGNGYGMPIDSSYPGYYGYQPGGDYTYSATGYGNGDPSTGGGSPIGPTYSPKFPTSGGESPITTPPGTTPTTPGKTPGPFTTTGTLNNPKPKQPGQPPAPAQPPTRQPAPTPDVTSNTSIGLPNNNYAATVPQPSKFQYTPIMRDTPGSAPLEPLPSAVPDYQQSMPKPTVQDKGPQSSITFNAPSQGTDAPASGQSGQSGSILGRIGRAAAGMIGVDTSNPIPPAYRGLYDVLKPSKKLTEEQQVARQRAAGYQSTYGLGE